MTGDTPAVVAAAAVPRVMGICPTCSFRVAAAQAHSIWWIEQGQGDAERSIGSLLGLLQAMAPAIGWWGVLVGTPDTADLECKQSASLAGLHTLAQQACVASEGAHWSRCALFAAVVVGLHSFLDSCCLRLHACSTKESGPAAIARVTVVVQHQQQQLPK